MDRPLPMAEAERKGNLNALIIVSAGLNDM